MYITATEEDRLRVFVAAQLALADTNLWLRIEDGHLGYGDEPLWGCGRCSRSQGCRRSRGHLLLRQRPSRRARLARLARRRPAPLSSAKSVTDGIRTIT
jgi:hypothetical protein